MRNTVFVAMVSMEPVIASYPRDWQNLQDWILTILRMIICHIGSGASISAVIKDGKSVDTSMGMTPLEGLDDGNAFRRY